jgi:hypothetical protein
MTVAANLGLWRSAHVRSVIVTDIAAVLVLAGAFVGSRRSSTLNDQIVWMNLAVLALVVYALSNGMFLFVGRKRAGARRRALLPDLDTGPTRTTPKRTGGDAWVWLPGTRRAHRPGCAFIAGKPVIDADDARIRAEHLQRCEVCGG